MAKHKGRGGPDTREFSWEQAPGEGAEAFEAFKLYRDMEPVDRSYKSVATKLGKSDTLMARWGSRHQWLIRCGDYDRHNERIELTVQAKERVKMKARHVRLALAGQDILIHKFNRLQELKKSDPDKYQKQIDAMSPKDISIMMDVSTKVERQAMGENSTEGAKPVIIYNIEAPLE